MNWQKISLLEVLFAAQGLGLSSGTSRRAVRVGMALLMHLNRKTGRCDPGIETLMRGTGMCRSTVMRGLGEICSGSLPLFERIVHGGTHGTNRYLPHLDRMKAYADEYDLRSGIKKIPDTEDGFHMLKPDKCQRMELDQSQHMTPKPVEGTNRINQDEKACKILGQIGNKNLNLPGDKKSAPQKLKVNGFKRNPPRKTIMLKSADKKLCDAIQNYKEHNLYLIDESHPGAWNKAVALEAKKHGQGIEYLRAEFRRIEQGQKLK